MVRVSAGNRWHTQFGYSERTLIKVLFTRREQGSGKPELQKMVTARYHQPEGTREEETREPVKKDRLHDRNCDFQFRR